ncbi:MAG TPA: cellulase family glycosylhydrolase [Bacteroidia bacterium]
MKKILSLFFLFSHFAVGNSFLHRSHRTILDSTEKPVQLRGVNLGGWLLWEEWIWGGGFHSQTHIMDALTQMSSREDAEKFRDSVCFNYISESDIKKIHDAHMNVVRVPFNWRFFSSTGPDPVYPLGWRVLDSLLARCKRHGVYAILDMHAAPGGNSPYFIADPEKTTLWKSEENKKRCIELWKDIADRYKNNPAVGGYDLLNEPIPGKKEDLVDLYGRIIAAIREVDQNHMIVLEGGNFAKDFSMFAELPTQNMIFEFHFYNWFGGDPGKKMKPYTDLSARLDVPLWCGEWGENKYEVITATRKVLEDPAYSFSGWCFWTWKKVPNGYPALNAIVVTEKWKTLITASKKPGDRRNITKEFALGAMKEFLNDIRSKNNKTDETLLNILK